MVVELELQHYQVKVGYLGFMNLFFICVQLINMQPHHHLMLGLELVINPQVLHRNMMLLLNCLISHLMIIGGK